jgi:hypothetical protein
MMDALSPPFAAEGSRTPAEVKAATGLSTRSWPKIKNPSFAAGVVYELIQCARAAAVASAAGHVLVGREIPQPQAMRPLAGCAVS